MKRGIRGQGAVVGLMAVLVIGSGCSTPKPSMLDPEIKVLSDGANAAYLRGEVERADALYGKALQRARLSDNRVEISRNAYNLALCRMGAGKLEEARGLLSQASELAGTKGQEGARIRLAESEVARLSGKADESGELARQAVLAGADREGRVHAQLLQSEAALVSGQVQGAREFHKAAKSGVSAKTPALIQARLEAVAVGLVQAGAIAGDVGVLQLSRADWLKKAGQFTDMVSALNGAAQHFEKMEKWAEAFDCRIRSAQSLLAAGNRDAAIGSARQALNLAERSGLAGQKALAAAVMKELN